MLPLAVGVTRLTAHLLRRVKHLEGLMHVCSSCHRVREGDDWVPMDNYLRTHSEAELAASLCRRCLLEQFSAPRVDPPEEVDPGPR